VYTASAKIRKLGVNTSGMQLQPMPMLQGLQQAAEA